MKVLLVLFCENILPQALQFQNIQIYPHAMDEDPKQTNMH